MIGSDAYNYINVLNKAAGASWTKNEIIANGVRSAMNLYNSNANGVVK